MATNVKPRCRFCGTKVTFFGNICRSCYYEMTETEKEKYDASQEVG